jgi:flavodoxin
MKTLVTYVSQTGNTRKVAEAIFDEIQGDKEIKELSDLDDLEGYDLCFVGFPVIAFGPNPTAKEFLEKNAAGKMLAMFVTHGAPEDQEDLPPWLEKCRQAAAGADIVAFFDCQGEVDQNVIDLLLKSDDPTMQEFGRRGPESKGQPDKTRLQRARKWAAGVLGKF